MVYIETSLKMVQQIDVSPTYKKNTTEKNTININHHPFTRDELSTSVWLDIGLRHRGLLECHLNEEEMIRKCGEIIDDR